MNNTINVSSIKQSKNFILNKKINKRSAESSSEVLAGSYLNNIQSNSQQYPTFKVGNPKIIQNPNSSIITGDKDYWFIVLDKDGNEGLVKTGELRVNEKQELTIQNYKLISVYSRPVISPTKTIPIILSDGSIVVQKKQGHYTSRFRVAKLKLIELKDNDVACDNSGICYLTDSGLVKYKENDKKYEKYFQSILSKIINY